MAKTVKHQELEAHFGEHDHLEVSRSRSFSSLAFELLAERAPTGEESRLFDLILNLSIDHGPDTPSAVKTIEAARAGKNMSESLSEGILQINDRHGGAIEPAMKFFQKVKEEDLTDAQIEEIVREYIESKKIIGGFGHRIYKDKDPRTELIFKKMKEVGMDEEFMEIAEKVRAQIEKVKGVNLPINIDGAIAVVLCTFGWEPKLGNAVFLIARTPGLIGQYLNNS